MGPWFEKVNFYYYEGSSKLLNYDRNLSERCPGDQTNNRAELIAIIRALETTNLGEKGSRLIIKTDSQ